MSAKAIPLIVTDVRMMFDEGPDDLPPIVEYGDPAITMFMDDPRIIFRDQAALDDYIAGIMREVGRTIESMRQSNPMNGDGSNYTIDKILKALDHPGVREGQKERWVEMMSETIERAERLSKEREARITLNATQRSERPT